MLVLSTIVGETLMMSRYPPLQPETLEQQQEKKQHPISRKPSPSHVDRSTLMGSLEGQRK